MFKIQQSGLILLAEIGTEYSIILSPEINKGVKWWKLEVVVENLNGEKDRGLLYNATGKVRLFKQLNSAIDFIESNCSHIKEITVKINEDDK